MKENRIKGVGKRITSNIITSSQGQKIIQQSKDIFPPGFHGLSVYEVMPAFLQQLKKTNIRERASGISFNIVMAIPPVLMFLFTLIPLLPLSKAFIHQLYAMIQYVIPGEKNNTAIIQFLDDFLKRPRKGLLSFGLLVAIFFSSNAMMGILRTFDKNYPGFLRRRMWQRRKVALKLTMIGFLLMFVCMLLIIAQASVLRWIGIENATIRSFIHAFRWVLIFLLTFAMISFIYRHGPAVTKKWPLITPGSIFATSAMILATALVSFWVNNFSTYNKLYGSISAIFILMSLVFVNSFAILMGFELNVTLTQLKAKKAKEVEKVEQEVA